MLPHRLWGPVTRIFGRAARVQRKIPITIVLASTEIPIIIITTVPLTEGNIIWLKKEA